MISNTKPKTKDVSPGKTKQPSDIQAKWWLKKVKNINESVFSLVNKLNNTQTVRYNNSLRFAGLYQNIDLLASSAGFYGRQNSNNSAKNRVTYNVVKSCIDSAAAKIAKNKPKIQFLTEEGDYKLQKRGKNLTQYCQGLFNKTNAYYIGQRLFIDACVWGTGCGHIFVTDDNNIGFERVFSQEITIDDLEAVYGEPQSLYRTKLISKDQLKELFPKFEKEIENCNIHSTANRTDIDSEQVKVIEAWHLKSGTDATDGAHSICIENATLFFEEYDRSNFPFVFFNWNDSLMGFWGQALTYELVGIQLEINKLLRSIQLAQDTMALPTIFVENGTKLSADQLTVNRIARIVNYTGTVPTFATPSAIAPEIYSHLENLIKKAYEMTGISQLSASAKKPEGLDSGVAIREYSDIESERFVLCGQRYEKLFMDIAEQFIDISKYLYDSGTNITVKVNGAKFVRSISWKDVDLDRDQYLMQAWPINMLPSTPAGKLATVQNLIQAGIVPQQFALSLLDFPDLEEFTSLQNASLDLIAMLIGDMLDNKAYVPPSPYIDLQLAMTMTHSAYLKASQESNVSPQGLDQLRTFMQDIIDIQQKANPPPPAIVPPAAPQAIPTAAPVSDLLPNAPQPH